MSASKNLVLLIGHLGGEPELRAGSTAIATFNLATTERYTTASGEKKEQTEWHRVVAFGRLAENCHKYLKKGSRTLVMGRLQTRSYSDKEGRERSVTEVKADDVQFLDTKGGARE